jgi:hypothetical protein
MPLRSRGAEAAEKANAASGNRFGKHEFFKLQEGGTIVLRFLTHHESWPSGQVHMGIPTKPAPTKTQKNWPQSMPAVCQNDKANFFDPDTKEWDDGYGACWIDANCKGKKDQYGKDMAKTSLRCWAAALVIEEADDGSGKKVSRPARNAAGGLRILLVNQSWFGFFSQLNGIAQANGSVTDRDMWIKLNPKGNAAYAQYSIIPRDADPERLPGTETWAGWMTALEEEKLDLPELEALVLNQSSPDYYARFFDPDKTAEDDAAEDEEGGSTQADPAGEAGVDSGVSDGDLDAMEARMRDRLAKQGAPAATS